MRAHLQSYAARTSAHGFAYLSLRGGPLPMARLIWSAAITLSLFTSGCVLWSSIREMDQNPISTSMEYVPIQEIPFPAVTLRTQYAEVQFQMHLRLLSELREQFRIDCREPHIDDLEDCVNRTLGLRLLFKPAVKAMLKKIFANIMDMQVRRPNVEQKHLKVATCSFQTSLSPEVVAFGLGLYPLIRLVSASSNSSEHLELVFNILSENFKLPLDIFFSKLADNVDWSNFTSPTGADWNCLDEYPNWTTESRALAAVLVTIFYDNSGFSLASLHELLKCLNDNDIQLNETFWENLARLNVPLTQCSQKPFSNWTVPPFYLMEYLIWHGDRGFPSPTRYCNYESGGCTGGEACCTVRDFVQQNYAEVLFTLDLFKQPLGPNPRSLREHAFMEQMTDCPGVPEEFKAVPIQNFRLNKPALITCSLNAGYVGLDYHCNNITETLTSYMPGHTFNMANFFEIFRESATMQTFCRETVQLKNYNPCTSTPRELARVQGNGVMHALGLMTYHTGVETSHSQLLVIHPAHNIPDIYNSRLEVIPGFVQYIEVTPRLTTTDENLLQKEQSVRNCHAEGIDRNPLKIFKHYSRENCIFECKLDAARAKCGCTHYAMPRRDGDALCAKANADCFTTYHFTHNRSLDCLHCRDECTRVDYDVKVRLAPIEPDACLSPTYHTLFNGFMGLHPYDSLMQPDLQSPDLDGAFKNKCFSFMKKNAAIAHVYFGPPTAIKIIRRPRVTFLQQLANLGGMVALFTGMSILSVFELLMWLAEIPWVLRWSNIKEKIFGKSKKMALPKIA